MAPWSLLNWLAGNMHAIPVPVIKDTDAGNKITVSSLNSLTWIESDKCQHCEVQFSARGQKHHCEACGGCVCAACVSFVEMSVQQSPEQQVKLCETCNITCKEEISIGSDNLETNSTVLLQDTAETKHTPSTSQLSCPITSHPQSPDGPMIWLAPRRLDPYHLNRDSEEQQVDQILYLTERPHSIDLAITGPPGVGKTEIVLKFSLQNKYKFDHIFWINGESIESVEESFKKVACILNIEYCEFEILICTLYKYCSHLNCVFIFDNVWINIEEYLPCIGIERHSMFVIVTSQMTEWSTNIYVPISHLSLQESVNYIQNQLTTESKESCVKLLHLFNGYNSPLLLKVIISYIKYHNKLQSIKGEQYHIENFILQLNSSNKEALLSYKDSEIKSNIGQIWDKGIENVKNNTGNDLAIKILNMMAHFDSLQIPISIFEQLDKTNNENYLQAIVKLLENSLIETTNNNFVSINPLLQEILLKNFENQSEILDNLLEIYTKPNSINNNNIEHVIKIWNACKEHDCLVETYIKVAVNIISSCIEEDLIYSFVVENIEMWSKISAWENMNFLKVLCKLSNELRFNNKPKEATLICDLILECQPEMYNDSNTWNTIDVLFCKGVCADSKDKGISVLSNLYHTLKSKLDKESEDLKRTLTSMCEIACHLLVDFEDDQAINNFLYVINSKTTEIQYNYAEMLEILNCIKDDLIYAGKEQVFINLYNVLYLNITEEYDHSHPIAIATAYSKAEFLVRHMKMYKEAYPILENVNTMQIKCSIDNCNTQALLELVCKKVPNCSKTDSDIKRLERELQKSELQFKDSIQSNGASHSKTLLILLEKAEILCTMGKLERAWLTYETVCQFTNMRPKSNPNRKGRLFDIIKNMKKTVLKK